MNSSEQPKADSKDPKERLGAYRKWYAEAEEHSRLWRDRSEICSRFYHGGRGQWDEKDAKALEDEGRPVLSINRVKPTIDLQKGLEIRNRTDIDAKPRGADDGGTADVISAGLKYVQDQNMVDHKMSDVFFDGLKAGIGWIEVGENDDPTEEEISISYADWKLVGWDPMAKDILLNDARYMYKKRWVDLDVAKQMWPEHADELQTALEEEKRGGVHRRRTDAEMYSLTGEPTYLDCDRERVLLVQMYFKKCEPAVFLKMKNGDVQEVSPEELMENPLLVRNPEILRVIKRPVDKIWRAIYSGDVLLEKESLLPHQHKKYPLVPFIVYRDENGAPYGQIFNMLDPQREINKSRSQYSYILSTRRVFFETGALKNSLEAKKEVSRPDCWIEMNPGALQNKKFQFSQDLQVAKEFFMVMQEAKQELQEVAGSEGESMGWETNARSGTAIEARQRQGSMVNTEPFDNLRLTKKRMGELILAHMRSLWTYEKTFRITDEETGADKFVTFNQGGSNTLSQSRYDIAVDEHPETATTRSWMTERLIDFSTRMPPEMGLPILQVAFELADIPHKNRVVEKLAAAAEQAAIVKQQELINASPGLQNSPPAGDTAEGVTSPAQA